MKNVFECLVVPFQDTTSQDTLGDITMGFQNIGGKIYSVALKVVNDTYYGYLAPAEKCDSWTTAQQLQARPGDLSPFIKNCHDAAIHDVLGLITSDDKKALILKENFVDLAGYEVDGGVISKNGIMQFLISKACDVKSATEILQAYLASFTITEAPTFTTDPATENGLDSENTMNILGYEVPKYAVYTAAGTALAVVGMAIGYGITRFCGNKKAPVAAAEECEMRSLNSSTSPQSVSISFGEETDNQPGSQSGASHHSSMNGRRLPPVPTEGVSKAHDYSEIGELTHPNGASPVISVKSDYSTVKDNAATMHYAVTPIPPGGFDASHAEGVPLIPLNSGVGSDGIPSEVSLGGVDGISIV